MSFAPPDPSNASAAPSNVAAGPTNDPAGPLDIAVVDQPPPPTADPLRGVRPGDLTDPWRLLLGLGWVGAFFAYAGIWQASVQIGIGTWWIGPRAQPTNVALRLLPFVLALVMTLLVVYSVRHVVRWSAVGVACAALIALPDLSRSVGLGAAEALIAALLGVITLASLSGRYQLAPAAAPDFAPD